MSLTTLLALWLMFSPGALRLLPGGLNSFKLAHRICLKVCCFHNNLSFVAVRRLPQPHVADVDVLSAKQALRVSWLVNHTSLLGATSELQISQTENHTIVYSVSPEGFRLFTLFFFSNSKYI